MWAGLTFRQVLCIRLAIPAVRIEYPRSAKLLSLRRALSLSLCPNVSAVSGYCSLLVWHTELKQKAQSADWAFVLSTSGDSVWHSDTCLHSSRCHSSAANNVIAKRNFSVFDAMLSLSSCPNVRPDPGFSLSQRLAIIICSTPFQTSCVFISRDADSLPLTYKLVLSA